MTPRIGGSDPIQYLAAWHAACKLTKTRYTWGVSTESQLLPAELINGARAVQRVNSHGLAFSYRALRRLDYRLMPIEISNRLYWQRADVDKLIEELLAIKAMSTTRQAAQRLGLSCQSTVVRMREMGFVPHEVGAELGFTRELRWRPEDVELAVATYRAWKRAGGVPWSVWISPPTVTAIPATTTLPPSRRNQPKPKIQISHRRRADITAIKEQQDEIAGRALAAARRTTK